MQRPASSQRPRMSEGESELWRELIRRRCGLHFGENRLRYLSQCLWARMKQRGTSSYGEYYQAVASASGEPEWAELLELLLNNETSFFRHAPAFEALAEHVLPELAAEKLRTGVPAVHLWSAGCSTGQEPYSLAMVALEVLSSALWQIRVAGTDLSERSLEKARQGRYKPRLARAIPERHARRATVLADEGGEPVVSLTQELRSLVRFHRWNLVDPEPPPLGPQDVIFCQNVLIYFRQEERLAVVRRLCEQLAPGGYLFPGPAEVVGLKLPGIRSVNVANCVIHKKLLQS